MNVAHSVSTSAGAAPAVDVVNRYLRAFYTGNFDDARSVVGPSFSFEGPFLHVDGREGFFRGAEGLRSIVGGHELVRQWVDGDEVTSLFAVKLKTAAREGDVLMSEWHTVRDGLIVRGRVVFDTAQFRSIVPAP